MTEFNFEEFNIDEEIDNESVFSLSLETIQKLHDGTLEKELTEEELVVVRFVDSMEMREAGSPTIEDIMKILTWYNRVRIQDTMLEMFLDGDVHVYFKDNNPEEEEPYFSITHQGREKRSKLNG